MSHIQRQRQQRTSGNTSPRGGHSWDGGDTRLKRCDHRHTEGHDRRKRDKSPSGGEDYNQESSWSPMLDGLTIGTPKSRTEATRSNYQSRPSYPPPEGAPMSDLWWDNAEVQGHMDHLASELFRNIMERKGVEAWKRYIRHRYRKRLINYLRKKQFWFRTMRMRILLASPTYRPYFDGLKAFCSHVSRTLRTGFDQLGKNLFAFRGFRRRALFFTIIRSRQMERIAYMAQHIKLLRFGFLGWRIFTRLVKENPEMQDEMSAPRRHEKILYTDSLADIVLRALTRWKRRVNLKNISSVDKFGLPFKSPYQDVEPQYVYNLTDGYFWPSYY